MTGRRVRAFVGAYPATARFAIVMAALFVIVLSFQRGGGL